MLSLRPLKRSSGIAAGVCQYSKSCFAKVKTEQAIEVKPTVEKERISKEILESFDSSSFLAVYHYNDINCNDWRRIRSKLRKNDIKLRVVPVKLTSRILQDTQYKNITPLFKGSTVIAFGETSTDVSHLLTTTKKERKLHMMGGIVDKQIFTPSGMVDCAKVQPLAVQHMGLSMTLTSIQSHLSKCLLSSQQHLCSQLERVPDPMK